MLGSRLAEAYNEIFLAFFDFTDRHTHFTNREIKLSPSLIAFKLEHGRKDDAEGTARFKIHEKTHLNEIQ